MADIELELTNGNEGTMRTEEPKEDIKEEPKEEMETVTLPGKEEPTKKEEIWIPSNKFNARGIKDFGIGMKHILLENKINVMLFIIPFGLASKYVWGDIPTFVLCMLSIMPLAKLLGIATEELALHTSETIGGLLNATFGNAVELIIAVIALKKGLLRVVQASLLGSILSNLLLVLGMSFFFGGIKYQTQRFNATAAQTSSSLLLLSSSGIVLPAAFFISTVSTVTGELLVLKVSRGASLVMLVVYVSYLIFQLKTHKHLYEPDGKKEASKQYDFNPYQVFKRGFSFRGKPKEKTEESQEMEPETSQIPLWGAVVILVIVTILVSILAEFLVGSIESVTEGGHVTQTFIAIILLPVVGNAAEHVTAVSVATKDKMDLSIGVAVGSSLQISMLLIPFLVVLGWMIGQPLDLYFQTFETVCLLVTVIIVNAVISDGESNWLEGVLLVATYTIIAIGFWFHP